MKLRNLALKIGMVICSFAFMVAISSLDKVCMASFYQPEVPKSLANHCDNL